MVKLWKKGAIGAIAVGLLASGLPLYAKAFEKPVNGRSEIISADYGIVENVEFNKKTNDKDKINRAKSSDIDGGFWIRGKRDGEIVSEYKHYTKQGRASVTNGAGYHDDGGWQKPYKWSKASLDWSFWGTNRANYDYR